MSKYQPEIRHGYEVSTTYSFVAALIMFIYGWLCIILGVAYYGTLFSIFLIILGLVSFVCSFTLNKMVVPVIYPPYHNGAICKIYVNTTYEEIEKQELLGIAEDSAEINIIVQDYLKEIGFKSYYWRFLCHEENNLITIDYGSHSTFIKLVFDSNDSFTDYLSGR